MATGDGNNVLTASHVLDLRIEDAEGDVDNTVPVIKIEPHDRNCSQDIATCVRIYPHEVYQVRASVGTITDTILVHTDTKKDYVRFTDSDRGKPSYPLAHLLSVGATFAFDAEGEVIQPSHIEFHLEVVDKTGIPEIVASEAFTGVVEIEYLSTYKVWKYQPQITEVGDKNLFAGNNTYGVKMDFGTIAAFYKGALATYDVPLWQLNMNSPYQQEIYRIESKVIVNEDGAWEVPDGWPNKTWPATTKPAPPDPGGFYATHQRTHEIGYLRGIGDIVIDDFSFRPHKPKQGNLSFRPEWRMTKSSKNEFFNGPLEGQYQEIDWAQLEANCKDRYPGLVVG